MLTMVPHKLDGKDDMVHYTSLKSKLVCKSVLSVEPLALLERYDVGYTIVKKIRLCTLELYDQKCFIDRTVRNFI